MATAQRRSRSRSKAATVGRRYVAAIADRDPDAMAACWAPDGLDRLVGQADLHGPGAVREYFRDIFAAIPDWTFELIEEIVDNDRYVFRWRATGTFAGEPLLGFEPHGRRMELEGCDVLQIADGLIRRNDAYIDGAEIGRQLGALPPRDSPIERRLTALTNVRTRAARRLFAGELTEIAGGVWLLRGGVARLFNVFFVRDGDGVAMFDAGAREMTDQVTGAGARLGGITRVVLGHSHPDHRGTAPGAGAPVYCHPDEVADAQGDGGMRYFDYSRLRMPLTRWLMPRLLRAWDGGPVDVAGTVSEGDEVGEFRVVHLPGHAPGLIALWRERDRLALCSDTLYTENVELGIKCPPVLPHPAYNLDTEQARASLRKLAALDPAAVWPGHADPVVGDVRAQLEHAAAAPEAGRPSQRG